MFAPSERKENDPVLYMLYELQRGQVDTIGVLNAHIVQETEKFDRIAANLIELRADLTEKQLGTSQQRSRKSDVKFFDIDLSTLKIIMILVYLLTCVGIMLHNKSSSVDGLKYLFSVMSPSHWIAISLFLAICRLIGRTVGYEAKILTYVIPVLGLWFWSMLFASSVIFSPLAGLTVLYVIPIVIEFWVLVQAFRRARSCSWRP